MDLEASYFKTNQSSVTSYDVDTFHPDSVINNPLTSDTVLHKIHTLKERQIQITCDVASDMSVSDVSFYCSFNT